ncbi:hypothetical protein BJF79_31205 [Actinomadura sp. CNU-125]|uniref:hypothetical protein n=1 Tax=Actinomadura sp. CNU-125 TaxID=1904961 RepID=UPI00095D7C1F|nr:hypothetical protein [Actinomadura sp. CNU-125]OLT36347.1 hypothetical protein BJF79_31205 [Actinomadura sp. CNU-125]
MSDQMLTVATLNLQDGRELQALPELLAQIDTPVDLLFFQEGKRYDADGQFLRYRAEELLGDLGLRSYLTPSQRGSLHELVFARWPRLRPRRHYKPGIPGVFHDQHGIMQFTAPGLDRVLVARSFQWAHWNGDVRLDEAQKLTRYAAPEFASVFAGDFNSLWPDCPGHTEFEPDWQELPPHKRTHKTLPPGIRPNGRLLSDRRALTLWAEAGFISAACLAGDMTVTVNDHVDYGQGAHIDHIVTSPWLAQAIDPDSYRVHVSDLGNRTSDHRLVSVRLHLDRLD